MDKFLPQLRHVSHKPSLLRTFPSQYVVPCGGSEEYCIRVLQHQCRPYSHTLPLPPHPLESLSSHSPSHFHHEPLKNEKNERAFFPSFYSTGSSGERKPDGDNGTKGRLFSQEEEMMVAYIRHLHSHSIGVESFGRRLGDVQANMQKQIAAMEETPWWRYPLRGQDTSSSHSLVGNSSSSFQGHPGSCSTSGAPTTATPSSPAPPHAESRSPFRPSAWKETYAWWREWAVWCAQTEYQLQRKSKRSILSFFPFRCHEKISSPTASSSSFFLHSKQEGANRSTPRISAWRVCWWWMRHYLFVPLTLITIFELEVHAPARIATDLHIAIYFEALKQGIIEHSE